MTYAMLVATLAWLSLLYGLLNRRHRRVHVFSMLTGISLDVCLVLYLQVTREAVQTALAFNLSALEQVHIACSSFALVLYLPVVIFGFMRLKGGSVITKRLHVMFAVPAFCLRTLGFLFMFSMLPD